MSRSISTNLYLRPGSIAIYGKFYLWCLYYFRFFSGLSNIQIWSINYALRSGSAKIHKHCLYWSVVSTNINRKIIFNCLLLFKLLLLVSKLYEPSQEIPQFFSDMLRNWGQVHIGGCFVLSFMDTSIPTFQY